VKVVVLLVQGQVGWVLVQAQVLQGLVLVQEGQVVVGKENLRGQNHDIDHINQLRQEVEINIKHA
jgi:hypothetical protein